MKELKVWISQIFTMMLFILSLSVVFLLMEHKEAWGVIVVYWIVLSAKNGFEYIFGWFGHNKE